jgi:hypothetical protein
MVFGMFNTLSSAYTLIILSVLFLQMTELLIILYTFILNKYIYSDVQHCQMTRDLYRW